MQFRINNKGDTLKFLVMKGICYGCDEVVILAFRESDFTSGRDSGGSKVNFLWEVTVEFRL